MLPSVPPISMQLEQSGTNSRLGGPSRLVVSFSLLVSSFYISNYLMVVCLVIYRAGSFYWLERVSNKPDPHMRDHCFF